MSRFLHLVIDIDIGVIRRRIYEAQIVAGRN